MIQDRAADNAASDDNGLGMGAHGIIPLATTIGSNLSEDSKTSLPHCDKTVSHSNIQRLRHILSVMPWPACIALPS